MRTIQQQLKEKGLSESRFQEVENLNKILPLNQRNTSPAKNGKN